MVEIHWSLIPCIIVVVQASLPLPSNFTNWGWLSSVVVGKYLYIDGGEYSTRDQYTGEKGLSELNSTLVIDLSTSWTSASISANNSARGFGMKPSRRPLLWYHADNHVVYEWGGWTFDDNNYSNKDSIWTFSPDGQGRLQWTQNPAPTTEGYSLNIPFGSSTVYTPAAFYSLGGTFIPPVVDGIWLKPNSTFQGLLSLNFSDNMWTNTSSAEFTSSGFSVLGEACFVPNFGQQGLLIFLGGDSPPNTTYQYEEAAALVSMAIIPLFDIHTGTWYHQIATGDVPPGRAGLCAVGAPTADNSSFDIFVYGGYSNSFEESLDSAAADFEDVFVLSLPAFNWFRAAAGTRRAYHTCQLVGGRQLLSVGGFSMTLDHKPDAVPDHIDPWAYGIGVFDMTDLSWSASYNSNAMPYEQSTLVSNYYLSKAGTPTWNDPALAKLFTPNPSSQPSSQLSSQTSTRPPSRPSSTPSSASTTGTPAPKNQYIDIGSMVGGVIGGLAGLCAILALAAFLIRRRPRQNHDKRKSSSKACEEPPEYVSVQELSARSKFIELGPTPVHELGASSKYAGELEVPSPNPDFELDASEIADCKRQKNYVV